MAEIQVLAGIHTLNETLILLPQDCHLVLKAAPGEVATVSGRVPLGRLIWKEEGEGVGSTLPPTIHS